MDSMQKKKCSQASAGLVVDNLSAKRDIAEDNVHEGEITVSEDISTVTLAEYLCQEIAIQGVSHIFMIPGGYVDNFSQGIVNTDGLSAVVAASEAGAAMMADGYARASRKFGVCLSISGPGATNMTTGLGLSNIDQIPVLAITGEPPLNWRDRDAIQDAGTQGLRSLEILKLVSKAQYQVFDAALAGNYMQRIMALLQSTNKGVVNLSVPMDRQTEKLAPNNLAYREPHVPSRASDRHALERTFNAISNSKKCVLLAGAGVRKSDAAKSLVWFAEKFGIPVATTMSAKGDFPENHPLSLGVFGWAGTNLANELLMNGDVDCLIVVGSKLGQIASMCWSEDLRADKQLIHIDMHSENINQTYTADLSVVSDAQEAFKYLVERAYDSPPKISAEERQGWVETVKDTLPWHQEMDLSTSEMLPIHPGVAVKTLSSKVPSDTQVFVDNGAHTFFTSHYWEATEENHFFSAIKYSGAMGWAIPASIGAKVAQPEKLTVAFVGDGCMLMEGIEIQTAVRFGLKNIIFVIMNNRAHGNPKLRAQGLSDDAQTITDIADHDWKNFAKSLGLAGYTINKTSELETVFEQALSQETPALIDIKCGLYETPTKMFDQTFMKEFNKNLSF